MADKNLQNFANDYGDARSELRDLEREKEDRKWYYEQIDKAKKGKVECISITFEIENSANPFLCAKDDIKKELIELLLRDKEKIMQDLDNKIKAKEEEIKKIIKNFKDN